MSQQPNQDCTTVRFLSETFVLETMTDQEFDELWGRVIDYGSDLVEEQTNGPAAIGRTTGRVLLSQLIEQNRELLDILGREADRRKRLALEASRQQPAAEPEEPAGMWIITWLGENDTEGSDQPTESEVSDA